MSRYNDTFRMNPITLCAVIGGVISFIAVGAIVDVLWVALGAALGAGVGLGVRRLGQDAALFQDAAELRETSSREQLYQEAQKLGVEGRSSMNRDQLAAAVAEHRASS